MLRLTIFTVISTLLFLSCTQEKQEISVNEKVKQLQKLAATSENDSTLFHLRASEDFIKLNMLSVTDSLKAENEYQIGVFYRSKGDFENAEIHLSNALNYIGDSIKNWRQVQYFYDLYDTYLAMQKYGDILALSNKYEQKLDPTDFNKIAYKHYFDSNAFQKIPDYEKAIESNRRRIDNFIAADDSLRVFPALIKEAELSYARYGNTQRTFEIFDSLVQLQNKLLPDYKRQLLGNYGVYKFYDGEYEEARGYYQKALRFVGQDSLETDLLDLKANIYNNLTEVNIELNRLDEARAYQDSVVQIGIHNIEKRSLRSFLKYQYLLAVKGKGGEYEILNTLDTLSKYQDLVYAAKINSELKELKRANEEQQILEREKQEAEIASLKFRNQVIILSVSIVLLAITGIFFVRQRKLRFEKQELQMQQRLLRSQMNPHFTFNTLYAIQNKIKEDSKGAINYLLKFSRLLRLILENSMQNYVSLEKELASLQEYLELQLMRFPNKFTYEIDTTTLEDIDLLFIPPMLLQPMVENSIEHGFANIDYPGTIRILLKSEGKFLRCEVDDNGQGVQNNGSANKRSASTQLISEYLFKATKSKLEVLDKKSLNDQDHGVLVRFLIPYKDTENG